MRFSSQTVLATLVRPLGLAGCRILLACTAGAPIAGRISDVVVRRAKEERKGIWVPEDRLRAVWLGGLVLIPISVTLAGFTTTYVDGMTGLIINLVCLFTNGVGVSRFPDISGTDASIHLTGGYGSHADWSLYRRYHAYPECRAHGRYRVSSCSIQEAYS